MGDDLLVTWKNFLMGGEQLEGMLSHWEKPKYTYNHKGELVAIEYIE